MRCCDGGGVGVVDGLRAAAGAALSGGTHVAVGLLNSRSSTHFSLSCSHSHRHAHSRTLSHSPLPGCLRSLSSHSYLFTPLDHPTHHTLCAHFSTTTSHYLTHHCQNVALVVHALHHVFAHQIRLGHHLDRKRVTW